MSITAQQYNLGQDESKADVTAGLSGAVAATDVAIDIGTSVTIDSVQVLNGRITELVDQALSAMSQGTTVATVHMALTDVAPVVNGTPGLTHVTLKVGASVRGSHFVAKTVEILREYLLELGKS